MGFVGSVVFPGAGLGAGVEDVLEFGGHEGVGLVGGLAWGNLQVNSGSDSSSKKKVKSNEYQERPPAGKVRMVYAGVPSNNNVGGGNEVVIDDGSSTGGGVDDEKQQWQQQQRGEGPSAIGQRRSVLRTTVCRPVYRPMRSIRRGIQPLECRI